MARRMSNRNRIDRMREEAEATARERKQERPADPSRLKMVWAVKDGYGEVVATFPYARKSLAEAEAARLKEKNRKAYIVAPHKVPF